MEKYPGRIQTIWNEQFNRSGTMYSLYCVREYLNDPFLLLESDIIYEEKALKAVIDHPSNECILMSGFSKSHDEVFIETKNNHLVHMSKDKEQLINEPTGELVGIVKISPRLFDCMVRHAEEHFEHSLFYNYETDALVGKITSISIRRHSHIVEVSSTQGKRGPNVRARPRSPRGKSTSPAFPQGGSARTKTWFPPGGF